MISGLAELHAAKEIFSEAAAELKKEKVPHNPDIEVGVMIEVPSAIIIADLLAKETDFFSIGTNDLIQYTLAIDRGNRAVAELFNPLHPAIIRMLKHLSDVKEQSGIRLFMCGEMASDPLNLPILIGLGLDELSMHPQAIPTAKNVIRSLSREESRRFLPEVLRMTRATDLVELMTRTYGSLIPEILYSKANGNGNGSIA
jgi:phosphotransferase system enzyme I (PtsI)